MPLCISNFDASHTGGSVALFVREYCLHLSSVNGMLHVVKVVASPLCRSMVASVTGSLNEICFFVLEIQSQIIVVCVLRQNPRSPPDENTDTKITVSPLKRIR